MELFFLALTIIFAIWLPARPSKDLLRCRTHAKAQLRAYQTTSSDERFVFDGALVEIILEDESISRDEGAIIDYVVSYFVRNAAGEYFMFIANQDSPPFFKHLEHSNAKIALGKKYVAPSF